MVNYIDEDKLLEEYGGTNPYKFTYDTVEERKETGYIPPWELPWATEWKKELASNKSDD